MGAQHSHLSPHSHLLPPPVPPPPPPPPPLPLPLPLLQPATAKGVSLLFLAQVVTLLLQLRGPLGEFLQKSLEKAQQEQQHEDPGSSNQVLNALREELERRRKEHPEEELEIQIFQNVLLDMQNDLSNQLTRLAIGGSQQGGLPTEEDIAAAKAAIEYNDHHFHFAVCGAPGSGKSSLINSLRGLPNKDAAAAKAGVIESTDKVGRYPDTRENYSHFVWYDIPGAGTITIPGSRYFIHQALYVFDFIVLVYDTRFTEIDVEILENCYRFKIPVFIVRSKADQHITNVGNDDGWEEERSYYRDKYIEKTLTDYCTNLKNISERLQQKLGKTLVPDLNLENQRVYIVSKEVLLALDPVDPKWNLKTNKIAEIIHEMELVQDMIKMALKRRSTLDRYGFELEKRLLQGSASVLKLTLGQKKIVRVETEGGAAQEGAQ